MHVLGIFSFILLYAVSYANSDRPNVVFILADDLGYNDIGYHAINHDSDMKTPYLDQLAKDGIKLENYYVQPICTPSRSQLMSGKYQIHTGLQHGVILAGHPDGLPLDNIILPEQLKNCGYDTHMVGKWHLGDFKKEYMPQYRGFNSFYGYLNGAEDYYKHTVMSNIYTEGVDFRDENGPFNTTWGQYSAHLFTDRAKKVIDGRDKSKPLFLYLPFQSVHYPMQVPDHYMIPFAHIKDKTRRTYAGMLAALDEAVMNITEHLKTSGMFDNTIIIFSTDNGGHTDYGGNNWPLRGRKATLWEGGVKGVGFVGGGYLKISDIKSNNFMHVSDWLPTLLSATSCAKVPGTQSFDGFDQWNAILQKEPSPRNELLHNIDPIGHAAGKERKFVNGFDITKYAAIRSGSWKLLTGDPGFSEWVKPPESQKLKKALNHEKFWPHIAVANGYDPYLHDNGASIKLFNIENDPYEREELSAKYPSVVMDLLGRLARYNSTAVPCRNPPADMNADPKYFGGYWGPWIEG
uniref:arylsulfatase B-like n=1 Tax=Styela clava TaxID=7725 RepID=UPI001939DCBA|nr:arylsulfatase B-like [Styela clava]